MLASGWMILSCFVQLFCWLFRPANVGKGRLTRVLSKRVRPRYLWRWPGLIVSRPLLALVLSMPLTAVSQPTQTAVYWLALAAFYLDDYYFGDDENWRKLKEGARNKVKWLMELPPRPAADPGTA